MLRSLLTIAVALSATVGTGCSNRTPASNPTGTVLVSTEESGGMCLDGACARARLVILRDGSWIRKSDGKVTERGTLSTPVLRTLRREIDALRDLDELAPRKRKRFCQSWVDGRDVKLKLSPARHRPLLVDSCEREIDDDHPAIKALGGAQDAAS